MSVERKEIRQGIVDLLLNRTSVGRRVFNSRDLDLPDYEVPCIFVYTREDSVNTEKTTDHHKTRRFRDLELTIEVIVFKSMSNYADVIDDLSEEINALVWRAEAARELHCSINEIHLSSESMSFDSDGDKTVGINSITYDIEYFQNIKLEATGLDDFKRAHSDMQKIQGRAQLDC